MEKHSESRLSYLFAHLPLLSSDLFSSDSSHLCFSTVHIVGSFTSKLPSIILHFVAKYADQFPEGLLFFLVGGIVCINAIDVPVPR